MKYMKYLLIPITAACINVSQAASAKQVNIPFSNEALFSSTHHGLFFNYEMGRTPTRKIVCEYHNVYKGWLEFRNHGSMEQSRVYGDGDNATITLTSKGVTKGDQYHADADGYVRLEAQDYGNGKHATASCHYEADDNV